jgi:hypothetical protein
MTINKIIIELLDEITLKSRKKTHLACALIQIASGAHDLEECQQIAKQALEEEDRIKL